jgi:hypothetical protein
MRRHGQAGWVKNAERGVVDEHRDGHIEELAALQGSFADRLLGPVGNGLDDLSCLPDGQMGEPACCRVRSGEGRDVAMDAGLDGALTLQQVHTWVRMACLAASIPVLTASLLRLPSVP